jgi:O-acetyl-ADP-ribose deacetylase (regulator of RNase III)
VIDFEVWNGGLRDLMVDAVVTGVGVSLRPVGEWDRAVRRLGGDDVEAACRVLRETTLRSGLGVGQAAVTTAGKLPFRRLIHVAGPIYSTSVDRSEVLADCYRNCLRLADREGVKSVAFPPISVGEFGWPAYSATSIAVETLVLTPTGVELVVLVATAPEVDAAYRSALRLDVAEWSELASDDWLHPIRSLDPGPAGPDGTGPLPQPAPAPAPAPAPTHSPRQAWLPPGLAAPGAPSSSLPI